MTAVTQVSSLCLPPPQKGNKRQPNSSSNLVQKENLVRFKICPHKL